MSTPTTLDTLNALKAALVAIPLDAESDPNGEKLFEAGELAPNKKLAAQLQALLVLKKRAFLLVPMGVRRHTTTGSGAFSVTGTKYLEVAIVYTDQAYFKAGQVVTFGGDKNLGLLGFDEKIEAALTGKDISPFGAIVLGDSDPIYLSDSEQKEAPGREAWLISATVPVALIATEIFS